ncbi:unnamed protein product, partial [Ectocarpus sp. 6 AP-2014]
MGSRMNSASQPPPPSCRVCYTPNGQAPPMMLPLSLLYISTLCTSLRCLELLLCGYVRPTT